VSFLFCFAWLVLSFVLVVLLVVVVVLCDGGVDVEWFSSSAICSYLK
jgi:hypothetical protein